MVQLSAVPNPPSAAPGTGPTATGVRERNRLARHRNYLDAALSIVFANGLEALTMQRLAAEVFASVGSVYTYFPSKGALLAEVQREATERLATSIALLGGDVDRACADADAAVAVIAPVLAFGRFWLTASDTYPEEMHLLLLALSDSTETIPLEEAGRVVPAAMRLLTSAEIRIDAAMDAGALERRETASERTIALAAALTGCVQLAVVSRWDPDLLDTGRIGRGVLDALLVGWGATRDTVEAAHTVIDQLEADCPLARPLGDPA